MRRLILPMLATLGLLAAAPAAQGQGQGWQIIPCPSCPGGYAAIPPWYGGGTPQGFGTQPYYGGGQFASPFPGGGGGGYPMVGEQANFGPPPASPFNSPPAAAVLPAYGGGNGCNGGGGPQWAAQPMFFAREPPVIFLRERPRPSHDFDLNLRSRLR